MVPPWWVAIGGCVALFGGVGRRWHVGNKQINNQLDCWWKAKFGVDERQVMVQIATNRSHRWSSATIYGRRRKTDASLFVVVMIVIIGEGRGSRGGDDISVEDRGKRGVKMTR
jgi:hypothetical protein